MTEIALLLALSTLWGASYPLIRVAVATIPPLTLIAARTVIAGSMLLAWLLARRIALPRDPTVWRRLLVQSLLNSVVPFTLIAWGEQSVGAGVATMLNAISPVLTFLAAWLLTRQECFTPWRALGVGMGLGGVILVIGPAALTDFSGKFLPDFAILVATFCYAGAALYGRSFRDMSPAVPAAGSMIVGAAILIPAALVVDRPWALAPSASSVAALAALAAFSTAIAFVIYFRLVGSIGPVATTAQAYLRVPIGVGLGIAFLGESLSPTGWAGLVCVVVGVAAMTIVSSPPEQDANARLAQGTRI